MRRCIFAECRRRPYPTSGRILSYHSFPRGSSTMVQWVNWVREGCGMYSFMFHPLSSSLCSRHFAEDCFRKTGRLQSGVLPTITPHDLDEAENASSSGCSNLVKDKAEKGETRKRVVMPPSYVDHTTTTAGQPEVFLEKYHEITDVVVEVQGNGEGSIPTPSSETKKKFPIDLSPDDFTNCQKAKRNLNILNIALSKTRSRLHAQAKRVRRVTKSVLGIRRLIQNLRKEEMITEEGQSELEVAVSNILDHINCKKNC